MIADAEAGKIDMILVKSILRFSRNTVDMLESVRHLREIGVGVFFEKEKTISKEGKWKVACKYDKRNPS